MPRRKKGRHASTVRTCADCGRVLEAIEVCECTSKLPKDGLRAKCPIFKARSSYRGYHFIVCGGRKLRFEDIDGRDLHYMVFCCGICRECSVYKPKEGIT